MDYQKELSNIESKIETQKLEAAKLEERKRQLTEEKDKILAELKEQNIKPEELEEIIEELEVSIQQEIDKCKKILN